MEEQTKKHKRKAIRFVRAKKMIKDVLEEEVLSKHFGNEKFSDSELKKVIRLEIAKVTGNHLDFIFIGHFNPYMKHYNFYYGKVSTDELYELTTDNKYSFDRVDKEDPFYDSFLNFLVDKIPPEGSEVNHLIPNYDFNFECFEVIND